jgi:hypothetical protein
VRGPASDRKKIAAFRARIPMTLTGPLCFARAPSGHTAASHPNRAMNSRRLIRSPPRRRVSYTHHATRLARRSPLAPVRAQRIVARAGSFHDPLLTFTGGPMRFSSSMSRLTKTNVTGTNAQKNTSCNVKKRHYAVFSGRCCPQRENCFSAGYFHQHTIGSGYQTARLCWRPQPLLRSASS